MRGLITNLLNPKAAVFYVAVLPAFMDLTRPATAQALMLSAVYVFVATLVHGGIVTLAGVLRPLLPASGGGSQTERQAGGATGGTGLF